MAIKAIRTFFLLLAGALFFAHMIIPHDHHMPAPEPGKSETCPLSGDRQGHHPLFPLHCHAFNDLTAEKSAFIIVEEPHQTAYVMVLWKAMAEIPETELPRLIHKNLPQSFRDNFLPDSSPLRAPPCIC